MVDREYILGYYYKVAPNEKVWYPNLKWTTKFVFEIIIHWYLYEINKLTKKIGTYFWIFSQDDCLKNSQFVFQSKWNELCQAQPNDATNFN